MTPADSGARCKHRPPAAPRDAATPRPSPHNPSPRALRVRRGRRRTLHVSSDAPSKRYRLGMPSFGLLLVLVITLELLRSYDWCAPTGGRAPNKCQNRRGFAFPDGTRNGLCGLESFRIRHPSLDALGTGGRDMRPSRCDAVI